MTGQEQFTGRDLGAEMATAERPVYHPLRFAAPPDQWAERQLIPPYIEPKPDQAPSGFVAACLVVALPVFSLAFTMGYLSASWGWL